LLLVLLYGLLNIPRFQQFLVDEATQFLESKLDTEVSIDRARLRPLRSLRLEGVFVGGHLENDTLLYTEYLDARFSLAGLWQKRFYVDGLDLYGVRLEATEPHLEMLREAFGGSSQPKPPPSNPLAWEVVVDPARINIGDIDVRLEQNNLEVRATLDRLEARMAESYILRQDLYIPNILIKGISVDLTQSSVEQGDAPPADSTQESGATPALRVRVGNLLMEEASVNINQTQQILTSGLGSASAKNMLVRLTDEGIFSSVTTFELQEGQFGLDRKDKPVAEGFDPNHLRIDQLAGTLDSIRFDTGNVAVNIAQLSGYLGSNMPIQNLQGKVLFQDNQVAVSGLALQTDRSDIQIPSANIQLTDAVRNLGLAIEVASSRVHARDVGYFAPTLRDQFWFRANRDSTLALQARTTGTLGNLQITRLRANGWGLQFRSRGRITGLPEPMETRLDMQILGLEASDRAIQAFIPEGSLPPGVTLPPYTQINGQVTGLLNDLKADFDLRTSRPETPMATLLIARAGVSHTLDESPWEIDVRIDSLWSNRSDLRAFTPDSVLPTGIEYPEQVLLMGSLFLSPDRLDPDIQLSLVQDGLTVPVSIAGSIAGYSQPEDMMADLTVEMGQATGQQLQELLPMIALPDSFRMPNLRSAMLSFSGNATVFESSGRVRTSVGTINLEANQSDSTLATVLRSDSILVDHIVPRGWLANLPGGGLVPWRLYGEADLPPATSDGGSTGTFALRISAANTFGWGQGLWIRGRLEPDLITGNLELDEREAQISGNLRFQTSDTLPYLYTRLDIRRLDFQRLRLSRKRFTMASELTARVRGFDPANLKGTLAIRDTRVRFDSTYDVVDSLLVDVRLDSLDNNLDLRSDLLVGNLSGSFDLTNINQRIREHLNNHLEGSNPLSVRLARGTEAYFNYELRVFETQLLTSGIIPGLRAMRPLFIQGSFNDKEQTLTTRMRVPFLDYGPVQIDSLTANLNSGPLNLNYRLHWNQVTVSDQFDINDLTLEGQLFGGLIRNRLLQRDLSGKRRFEIQTYIGPGDSTVQIAFSPNLWLNYQKWTMPDDNLVTVRPERTDVKNWRLSYGDQLIELTESQAFRDALEINFNNFRLENISSLVEYDGELLAGFLNGQVFLHHIRENLEVESTLFADDLTVLNAPMGDLDARIRGGIKENARIRANLEGAGNSLSINGQYNLATDGNLDVTTDIRSLNLASVQPFTQGNIEELTGSASGDIQVSGKPGNPDISGGLAIQEARIVPAINQVPYTVSGSRIDFTEEGIQFSDWNLQDPNSSVANLTGSIPTSNFRDFSFNLNVSATDFLALQTTRADNDLYYGTMRVDVSASLRGSVYQPVIRAQVSNRANSNITYVLPAGSSRQIDSGKDVIDFVDLEARNEPGPDPSAKVEEETRLRFGYDLELNLEITDGLQASVIMDEITGDKFVGRASGNLALRINSGGTLEMSGRMDITEGVYNFTYSEVIKRTFRLGEDSYIQFNGDPYDPSLSLKTQYRTQASITPLILLTGGSPNSDTAPGSANFLVEILVGGTLKDIELQTDIRLDGSTNSQASSALGQLRTDPSQLNTQAFSLILFNGFIAQGAQPSGPLVDFDIQSGLNDFITNQLNQLANNYISFVELNFGIESEGEGEALFEDTNFRVSLRKKFLNDRLQISIDGVATTQEDPNSNAQAFLDNLSVTYLLTPDGVLKIKVYNRRDDDDFAGGNTMRLGGALVFSKDFDTVRLFTNTKRSTSDE